MIQTATFESREQIRAAVRRLTEAHYPPRALRLFAMPGEIEVPVIRTTRILRFALVGLGVGAVVGLLLSTWAWGPDVSMNPLFIVALGAIWGLFGGMVSGAATAKVDVRYPERLPTDGTYRLEVEVPSGRRADLRALLMNLGGEPGTWHPPEPPTGTTAPGAPPDPAAAVRPTYPPPQEG